MEDGGEIRSHVLLVFSKLNRESTAKTKCVYFVIFPLYGRRFKIWTPYAVMYIENWMNSGNTKRSNSHVNPELSREYIL